MSSSIWIVRRGLISGPSSPSASRSIAWPMARITVSASNTARSSSSNTGAKRPSSSNTDSTPIVSMPVDPAVLDDDPRGAATGDELDALVLGLLDLEVVGRHLLARLERHDRDLSGPGACGGAGHVDGLGHRRAGRSAASLVRSSPPDAVVGGTQGGAGSVHGDVAAADHDHPFADVDLEPSVHVDQELDGLEHAVGLGTLDVEATAERGADAEEHGVVAFPQLVERDVVAEPGVVARPRRRGRRWRRCRP